MNSILFTKKEAEALLEVSPSKIDTFLESGDLKHSLDCGRVRVSYDEIQRFKSTQGN
ncbi:MAG: hypothetical protein Q9M40_07020 [Sulfurimonas sp.]|nr:hypothetical protein [Sulfurimonas sp.]MDQ7067725.1 hypothetical protein [Sulfurimonas sp.]